MKSVRNLTIFCLMALIVALARPAFATATCTGRFANPITDICWSCMMPLRFGGLDLVSLGQEDTPNPGFSAGQCRCFLVLSGALVR